MAITLEDRVFYGNNITMFKKNEDCTIYNMKDINGEGTMTCYKVFPGIDLLYNDFHVPSCFSEFRPKVDMLGIDHCREGRIEWEFQDGSYMYLEEGDLQINAKDNHALGFGFPLSHYHGITVAIYIDEALKTLPTLFDGFSVDLQALREKFCAGKRPFIMRAEDSIQHIFSELYTVPDKIRKNYFKIKVLELLLFLSVLDVPINSKERPYFPQKQVKTVKAIMKYISGNIDRHFTLNELSAKFDIPLTSLKLCFKGVYGTSINAYMRSYRMHAAALMLRQSNENVAVIAGKVGYDNSSKFAAAFKTVMGMSPLEHRKSSV
ncbi:MULTISPECIES: helix-turn-helix domain-containing protein [Pelosinus]|uniref:Helix-turn-helix, AraC domain-containing protein n=1 Tax=Pelosinus fermentans B4 TaxID=1149862 RepID=I8RBG6_9FIRM|nr:MULTISPECIES: AraC family transcriptional regulator [Pelosinus]EIW16343.1 Helix-turn-helix, AraC domain-containing protein [Pelosinus fermentans B4]EIW22677.1 transcriptional regulator, AraC family [Pelosinus fermentans A11]OAM95650.1 transcriptional regulator with only HTH domain, AraC family [Pelosinus fermentans DSM 17108]SDR31068.1 AraC-type DNA-binding protein [Pelosinus fermentans]